MARPSKLTEGQCNRIRMLKDEGVSAPILAKRFKLSESSVYKVLNGSYAASPGSDNELPPAVEQEDHGSTPSRFNKSEDSQLSSRVIKAADGSRQPVGEVTLAAAELIVAQARYMQARKHTR